MSFDNSIRDTDGQIMGFRCHVCDKVKSKMWGDICNQCRELRELTEKIDNKISWRCFHCDEVFTDHVAALKHFGQHQFTEAACQIDVEKYREMEETNRSYCEEDTELHRALGSLYADKLREVRRAEEAGYDNGVKDCRAQEAKLFDAIAHGDEKHRAWLKQAIDDHLNYRQVAAIE